MELYEFIDQWNYSHEKETEEKLWILYSELYPNFSQENFVSFPKFIEQQTGISKEKKRNISSNGKTNDELIAEAENILRKMEFVEKKI